MENTLCVCLKNLRTARGLSRRELAARAGIAPSTVGRWEAAQTLPRVPELTAALDALGAAPAERARALALLNAPRALVHVRQTAGRSAAGPPPMSGDLLRTLRRRSGKTLAEAARATGVSAAAVSAWERGEKWPAPEHLHALCRHLAARPEELAALLCGGLARSGAEPLDQRIERFIAGPTTPETAGRTDLEYLSLTARLWPMAERSRAARTLLGRLDLAYVDFLYGQNRYRECEPVAARALDILGETDGEVGGRAHVAVRAAQAAMEGGGVRGAGRAGDTLRWALSLPAGPADTVWMLCELGQARRRLGCGEEAGRLGEKAARTLESCGSAGEYAEGLHRVTMLFLHAGYPGRALETASRLDVTGATHPSPALALAQIFRALGSADAAHTWLQRAYDLLDALQTAATDHARYVPYYRLRADTIAATL